MSDKKPIEIDLVDRNNWYILLDGELIATNDVGKTWNKFNVPQNTVQIQFIDHKIGWALATLKSGTNLYYSKNGGYTWDKRF
ncbi:hypothetical protein [Thermoanaerobacter wiegelii]|uniref:hypothetical protein n=1 Tax=Thermoanaerobacter wiegelii TaxID=46354 RepID=UPI0001E4F98C|nr:hypothetical protein [Thermoanaerobacter wiegelii]